MHSRCYHRWRTVHPHVRGEYTFVEAFSDYTNGSPPRAWGIRLRLSKKDDLKRFTPTCVGNTVPRAGKSSRHAVHPHARGEYFRGDVSKVRAFGSPPRAWGILKSASTGLGGCRFTPTCVGNTRGYALAYQEHAVHPHVRGEYEKAAAIYASAFGSPPRAWGILPSSLLGLIGHRFTPTCVGNTFCWPGQCAL